MLGYGQWLQALSHALSPLREIAIVGEPRADDTRSLPAVTQDGYRPFQVVALGAPGAQPPAFPLLQDRGLVDGQAAAYVYRNPTCRASVMEPKALSRLLESP